MEQLLQYIWQHRLYKSEDMVTNDGRRVRVLDPGLLNSDSGPDFFNAKVVIDGRLWAGNIESHVRASDWRRHHHDSDAAYDSVVLHVVEKDDAPVYRTTGERIPQVVLQVSPRFNAELSTLLTSRNEMPCAPRLASLTPLVVADWMQGLAMERLHDKTDRIGDLLALYNGSWEDVCYVTLARTLGFGVNSDAFERLARRTPLRLLAKHSDSMLQIEAMLLGQAGLLPQGEEQRGIDPYIGRLTTEYAFLANKFSLKPMERTDWKLFRLRPQNFPYRRIAMLATFIHGGFRLMSDILEAPHHDDLRRLFEVELTGFWATHYTALSRETHRSPALSRASVDVVLINTVAPLLQAHAEATGNALEADRAVAMLETLPPEKNRVVNDFARAGIECRDALTSQALLQLRRQYCEPRKCIYCKAGHRLLAQAATESDI